MKEERARAFACEGKQSKKLVSKYVEYFEFVLTNLLTNLCTYLPTL